MRRNTLLLSRRAFTTGLVGVPALARSSFGQATSIRLGKQYGLPYLPQMVMESQQLIEKHAAALGVPTLTVGWLTMGGPGALNEALLSGGLECINVAPPTLGTLWDKTAGTPLETRGLCAVQSMPYLLVTRRAEVKTIADFTEQDRIAVPTAKISGQAMALQIAVGKLWGFANYEKLDPLTLTLPHPDAMQALFSGQITGHFAVAPFYYEELKRSDMHTVLKSYDAVGGKHTNGLQLTTKRFYDANPRICEAVRHAHEDANAFIKAHPRDAAEIYARLAGDKRNSIDDLTKMIADPDNDWTTVPANIMTLVEFMHKVGRIKRMPGSWKDLFLPGIHDVAGS